ncbi:MAG: SufS family cysteine desulfurase [Patescibacteria group bacterium]
MFDPIQLLNDFPILSTKPHGKSLVYLDSAATSQKPHQVIDAITRYYEEHNANVHRGVHALSDISTADWEESRQEVASFFGAKPSELIVTRNTTEAINGIVSGWAAHAMQPGDVIVTTILEHHSNFVPWQQLAERQQLELKIVPVDEQGRLQMDQLLEWAQDPRCKLLALSHVSNALGTQVPLEKIVPEIRTQNPELKIAVDGAQSAPHIPVNFSQLNIDFYAFSGHKMLAPMGVGGLLVRDQLLQEHQMQPWLFGGGMIDQVSLEKTTFIADAAERFTAGTPDVASLVGLAAACRYLRVLGMKDVAAHDQMLVRHALDVLQSVPEVTLIGPTETDDSGKIDRVGSVAFLYQGVHAHDVAQVLDSQGVAVRSGHHCTMPLHAAHDWQATIRASFHVYSTKTDVDTLVAALQHVKQVFGTKQRQ